jgi:hypothetical protein
MTLAHDFFVQYSQLGTLLLGCLAVWVAMFNQRRQLNAQMFIEVSGRFQELLRMFPTEAWLANRNPSQPLPPRSHEITDCTLYCFQLIADVYHVHQGGYVSKGLWKAWEREIKHILDGRIFRREWEMLAVEFSHNQDFLDYINGLMQPKQQMSVTVESCGPSVGGF